MAHIRERAIISHLIDLVGPHIFDIVNDLEARDHPPEDRMFVVKPRSDCGGDEELRAVAVERSELGIGTLVEGEESDVIFFESGEAYVLGPALAMERRKGLLCFNLKFSSPNFSP